MVYSHNLQGKIKIVNLTNSTQVNASATNNQDLQPDSGSIYKIRNLLYNAPDPAGSTAGTHSITAYFYDGTSYRAVFESIANTGTGINIKNTGLRSSTNNPSDGAAQAILLTSGIFCSNSYPIRFTYSNDTDANQTGTRTLVLLIEELAERS